MRKKITLSLDTLHVESFSTAPGRARRSGTVQANSAYPTDNWGSACCWESDTQCGGSDIGAGCDTYFDCGGGGGASHAPSCGATCAKTGIPYKCYDMGTCANTDL